MALIPSYQIQPQFIVENESDRNTKWENGVTVFCRDTNKYYILDEGSFVQIGAGTSTGTVQSVSVTTANGVSGSVATATTTPAITLTLGAITPTTVNGNTITTGTGTITITGTKTLTVADTASVSGTNTGDNTVATALTGTPDITVGKVTTTGNIELGHASDTTISRTGAGAIAVEGVGVLLSGGALGTPSSGTVTNLTGTASININGTVGATTPTTGAFTTLSASDGLTLSGTGKRIQGDFSNGTISSRTILQSSTTNGITAINIIPNGTGSASYVQLFNSSSPDTNTALFDLKLDTTAAYIRSTATSGGTTLPIAFLTAGAERLRIPTDAGGITFPATQAPSSDANTLDDYEEGTWTPALVFATMGDFSVSYSTQVGTYTKIGRQVTLIGDIVTSAFTYTTASGALTITGLPFAAASSSNNPVGTLVVNNANTTTTSFSTIIASGGSAIGLRGCKGSATVATFGNTEFPTTTAVVLRFLITYFV